MVGWRSPLPPHGRPTPRPSKARSSTFDNPAMTTGPFAAFNAALCDTGCDSSLDAIQRSPVIDAQPPALARARRSGSKGASVFHNASLIKDAGFAAMVRLPRFRPCRNRREASSAPGRHQATARAG